MHIHTLLFMNIIDSVPLLLYWHHDSFYRICRQTIDDESILNFCVLNRYIDPKA